MLYYVRAHPELLPEIASRREALASGERSVAGLEALSSPQTLALLVHFQRTVIAELVRRTIGCGGGGRPERARFRRGGGERRGCALPLNEKAAQKNLPVFS